MRNKTDRNDARGIAQVLRTGWFSPVHMKSRESHGIRALVSTRRAVLSKTIDLANEVRGLLKIFGIRLPSSVSHGRFDEVARGLVQMDEILAHAMLPLLDARLALYDQFLELDRRVKRAASGDEVCLRMMTVPGVGPIAALTFEAAVDDLRIDSVGCPVVGNPADIAPPFGVLDLADVNAFLVGFLGQDSVSDIAAPFGVWDLADVQTFITAFNSGCP